MSALTKAQDAVFACNVGLKDKAYEFCYKYAVTVRSAHDHDIIRFDDDTEVRVYVSEDNDITIIEA